MFNKGKARHRRIMNAAREVASVLTPDERRVPKTVQAIVFGKYNEDINLDEATKYLNAALQARMLPAYSPDQHQED